MVTYRSSDHLEKRSSISLEKARIDKEDGYALWVEEDYCSHSMERESVLDRYFNDITVQQLNSKKMDRTELMISLCFGEKNDAQYVTGALLIQSRINKVKLDKC